MNKNKAFKNVFSSVILAGATMASAQVEQEPGQLLPGTGEEIKKDVCHLEITKTPYNPLWSLTKTVCLDEIESDADVLALIDKLKEELRLEKERLETCISPFCGYWLG